MRRVAVGVVPDDEREVGYFTFRPQPDGVDGRRTAPVRDVHPMVGRRLNLWRLRDFELTRLEAPEDVLLLHAVAAGNPQDQRLVALAQVRQLVVVRDETGKVTAPAARRARPRQLPRGGPPGAGHARRRVPGWTRTTSGCTSGRRSRPTSTS